MSRRHSARGRHHNTPPHHARDANADADEDTDADADADGATTDHDPSLSISDAEIARYARALCRLALLSEASRSPLHLNEAVREHVFGGGGGSTTTTTSSRRVVAAVIARADMMLRSTAGLSLAQVTGNNGRRAGLLLHNVVPGALRQRAGLAASSSSSSSGSSGGRGTFRALVALLLFVVHMCGGSDVREDEELAPLFRVIGLRAGETHAALGLTWEEFMRQAAAQGYVSRQAHYPVVAAGSANGGANASASASASYRVAWGPRAAVEFKLDELLGAAARIMVMAMAAGGEADSAARAQELVSSMRTKHTQLAAAGGARRVG